MNATRRALIVTVLHLLIVSSLGAKLLYDRQTRPRVWVQTVSYDPDLPIRGRYISLQLVVEPDAALKARIDKDLERQIEERKKQPNPPAVPYYGAGYYDAKIGLQDGKLVVSASDSGEYYGDSVAWNRRPTGEIVVSYSRPVLVFIPEHANIPTVRPPDQLWVEVTIPKKGPPRPIQLGVKKNGVITPLVLN